MTTLEEQVKAYNVEVNKEHFEGQPLEAEDIGLEFRVDQYIKDYAEFLHYVDKHVEPYLDYFNSFSMMPVERNADGLLRINLEADLNTHFIEYTRANHVRLDLDVRPVDSAQEFTHE